MITKKIKVDSLSKAGDIRSKLKIVKETGLDGIQMEDLTMNDVYSLLMADLRYYEKINKVIPESLFLIIIDQIQHQEGCQLQNIIKRLPYNNTLHRLIHNLYDIVIDLKDTEIHLDSPHSRITYINSQGLDAVMDFWSSNVMDFLIKIDRLTLAILQNQNAPYDIMTKIYSYYEAMNDTKMMAKVKKSRQSSLARMLLKQMN